MGRPSKVDKSIEKTICLAQSLVVKVDLELMSELEGKVPFGAWKVYVTELISADLAKRYAGRAAVATQPQETQNG